MAKALSVRLAGVNISMGNGFCNTHIHFGADLASILKPVRLPTAANRNSKDVVNSAVQALRDIESSGEIPGIEFVKDGVLARLADRDKTTASIVEDGMTPNLLIYLLVTNVAWEELCSGQHHVYRGVLNLVGQQLLSAFAAASDKMVEGGHHEQAEHEREMTRLRQSIKEAG